MDFTGERFVPGQGGSLIAVEHLARYSACIEAARGKRVLDAASGSGYGSSLLSAAALTVTGLDISQEAVASATSRYASDAVNFVVGSVTQLPFPDDSFDLVVSFETIEHVGAEAQTRFLAEIRRVLTSEGVLIMSTPDKNLTTHDNPFHELELDESEFRALLGPHFSAIDIYYQNVWDYAEIVSAQKPPQQVPVHLNPPPREGLFILAVCGNQPGLPSIDSLYRSQSCLHSDAAAIYENSLSWRITRPLRELRALFRRSPE